MKNLMSDESFAHAFNSREWRDTKEHLHVNKDKTRVLLSAHCPMPTVTKSENCYTYRLWQSEIQWLTKIQKNLFRPIMLRLED